MFATFRLGHDTPVKGWIVGMNNRHAILLTPRRVLTVDRDRQVYGPQCYDDILWLQECPLSYEMAFKECIKAVSNLFHVVKVPQRAERKLLHEFAEEHLRYLTHKWLETNSPIPQVIDTE